MLRRTYVLGSIAFALSTLGATDAAAAVQRTFVSTSGNAAAACSLAAPCRTFDAALAQTATGGEIIVLDAGGYGAVGISKSVSIIAPPGVYAGITVFPSSPNGTGITINAPGKVVLRGLSINGQGGDVGIHVFGNPVVHIEDCVVANLDDDGSRISGLIGSPEVFIGGSTVRGNGHDGVSVSGAAKLYVDQSRIENNAHVGIFATDGPTVTVATSVIAGNGHGTQALSANGTTTLTISDSTISGNRYFGIHGQAYTAGSLVRPRATRNTITGAGIAKYGIAVVTSPAGVVAVASDNLVSDTVAIDSLTGRGIDASNNVTLTASNNVVTGHIVGLSQRLAAVFRTRNNNVVQDNSTNVLGTLTFVGGD